MWRHPVFPGLQLHTDDELSAALDVKVTSRRTVHEWPLACVQEIRLADGSHLAYKTQLPPTVEGQFYDKASSRLLPGHLNLGPLGRCETMVFEWIDAPLLRETVRSEVNVVKHAHRVVEQIGMTIRGELPAYLDISSELAWQTLVRTVFTKLDTLIAERRMDVADRAAVARARTWAESGRPLPALAESRICHGDLNGDQVFVTADGYRVIDWQRPVIAPANVDVVSLLANVGIDPRRHVDDPVVRIYWMLRLQWAVDAQHDLFAGVKSPLFAGWANEAIAAMAA